MTDRVNGTPRPTPGPQTTLVRLGRGEKLEGVILSETIYGVGTHWNDRAGKHGRSEPCTKESGECSSCNAKLPLRWKGYLSVYDFFKKRPVLLELTPGASESIELQAVPGLSLRGQKLIMRRGEGGNKTPLRVEMAEFRGDIDALPKELDAAKVLDVLWNWGR